MAEATRLTSIADLPAPDAKRVAGHYFRKMGKDVLITNDGGYHAVLSEKDYRRYLKGDIPNDDPLGKDLLAKAFFRDQQDFRGLAERLIDKNLLEWKGPNVHTVVTTLRCNFKCLYCHASVVDETRTDKDMDLETARRTVDLIFESPSPTLMIEFQGGEPLLNWPIVKFIAAYARKKNQVHKKTLHMSLISNFSLLDDEKIDALAGLGVSFCTSLDGPEALHNKNRIFLGGNTHASVVAGIKNIQARRAAGAKIDPPNAICTVTRASLPSAEAIIDHLVGMGLERIQIGPLDPIGFAKRSWGTIGYTSEEYVAFYARSLDHLIALNKKGVKAYEKTALILLLRILKSEHWRFPNADGLCRLAYNHDGGIYTSEEGRLLANEGDSFFRIGTVGKTGYQELMDHPKVRASMLAAGAPSQPLCAQCAYNPVCTVMPVFNYQTQGSLWGQMPTNQWCGKIMGIFDVLFERLADKESRVVLESWLEYGNR